MTTLDPLPSRWGRPFDSFQKKMEIKWKIVFDVKQNLN